MVKDSDKKKKLNLADLKDKLNEDQLDLNLCTLDTSDLGAKVRKINLSFNLLITLPDDFIKLHRLVNIDLSKNQLKELPKNFGQLVNLKYLDLLGNKLMTLPSSFSELKSLYWLDLKDNPNLNYQLKQVAGDCLDEKQCKKCAVNVVRYMKAVASDEERQRQIDLKRKREEQAKLEAAERQREIELREIKKQEREKRRVLNEQRKIERFVDDDDGGEEETSAEKEAQERREKAAKFAARKRSTWKRLSAILFIALLFFVSFNLFFNNFCDKKTRSNLFKSEFFKQEALAPTMTFIERDACPRFYKFNYDSGLTGFKNFIALKIAQLSKIVASYRK